MCIRDRVYTGCDNEDTTFASRGVLTPYVFARRLGVHNPATLILYAVRVHTAGDADADALANSVPPSPTGRPTLVNSVITYTPRLNTEKYKLSLIVMWCVWLHGKRSPFHNLRPNQITSLAHNL